MSRVFLSILFSCLLGPRLWADPNWGAVEVDEHGSARSTYKTAATSSEMRGTRRAGVGMVAGGISGIFGANIEINFTERFALNGGFGLSTDFQSLFLGGRQNFGGTWLSPYISYGYGRWFHNGNERSVGDTTPGFVGKKFLADREREQGLFAENLLFAGLGVQYLQLNGDWAGVAVYVDGLMILDVDDLVAQPNLGTGLMYYF